MRFTYPAVRREAFSEVLHGHTIADPYRWLEDPNSSETTAFVEAQNSLFHGFTDSYPRRETLKQQLTDIYNYEKFGCPFRRGSYYYHFYNSGLMPQSILYQKSSLTDKGRIFLDPNALSEDGTVSVNRYGFSKSGKLFAYALSSSGSDWVTIHVKHTDPDVELKETPVEWAKFTCISWTHDDKGFFYHAFPSPHSIQKDQAGTETDSNKNQMVKYHALGSNQDVLVYKDPENPAFNFGTEVSDDGNFLVLSISAGCNPENKLYVAKLNNIAELKWIKISDDFEAEFSYISNESSVFYFKTTLNAPKRKIVKYDIERPQLGFVDVIPESINVLEDVTLVDHNKLILIYLQDVKHVINVHDLFTGNLLPKEEQLPLPVGVIVQSLSGKKDSSEIFYSYQSFISPSTIYHHDFATKEGRHFYETQVKDHSKEDFQVDQVFYESKDGTRIPMFIFHRKGIELNGKNPTLLYGYGGFNISITPYFSVSWISFINHFNGVVAIANIRGGGEYGDTWCRQGKLSKKQNVFDDFVYAAQRLIHSGYTDPSHLIIRGGSNGGLLVAACVNQRPDLFRAGIADVGVMDMVRFSLFTIGHAWCSDYGNPQESKDDLETVLTYSPLHNVQKGKQYPAVLLTTGDHDDRVVPLHSYKLIATLQHELPNNDLPLMIRIQTKAGHGAGKSTQQWINETVDVLSFVANVLPE